MTLESFAFSTEDLRPADAFGAYHDLYAQGSDVGRVADGFRAEMRGLRFSRMLVYDRRVSAVRHARASARVRRDGFDHLTLQVLVAGGVVADTASGERRLVPGDVLVSDMTQPTNSRFDSVHLVTVSLARDLVEAAAPKPRKLHGLVLPAAEAGLLADFALSLVRRGPTLGSAWAASAPEALAHLLKATIAGMGKSLSVPVGEPSPALDDYRLQRIRSVIEARLSEGDLDVERIAAEAALSRTALYRACEPLGGIARYVQSRRLARLRAALLRPGEHRSVAALAFDCGFASESHCNRAFRKAYGLPPGRFRSEVLRAAAAGKGPDAGRGLVPAGWMRELV